MKTPFKRAAADPAKAAKLEKAKQALSLHLKVIAETHQLTGADMLALLAYLTGGAIAYQDQRVMTPEMAMDLVMMNLEAGNQSAIAQVASASGVRQ